MQVKTHFGYLTVIAALAGVLVWMGARPSTTLSIVASSAPVDRVAAPVAVNTQAPAATEAPVMATAATVPAPLDQQWAQQPVDAIWAARAEQDLHLAARAADGADTEMLSAICHSSVCRAELLHKDASAQERFLQTFTAEIRWQNHGQMQIVERSADGIRAVMFIARDE